MHADKTTTNEFDHKKTLKSLFVPVMS